jgi:hypothetical protein
LQTLYLASGMNDDDDDDDDDNIYLFPLIKYIDIGRVTSVCKQAINK